MTHRANLHLLERLLSTLTMCNTIMTIMLESILINVRLLCTFLLGNKAKVQIRRAEENPATQKKYTSVISGLPCYNHFEILYKNKVKLWL